MTGLHLALSAAETLGRLLELPRTVRSLAARVERATAEATKIAADLEEARDQRDRQWQLVLDSRVNAAEQKLSEATFRAEMAEAALSTSEAEAASATERAKKYEAEVALACVEVERLITQREENRKRADKAEELVATMIGNVHGEPSGGVDIAKARGALQRLVDLAFNNPGRLSPRFSVQVNENDDDLILTRALEELTALRQASTAPRDLPRATSREVEAMADEAYRARTGMSPTMGDMRALAANVAERVRREQCLVTRAVEMGEGLNVVPGSKGRWYVTVKMGEQNCAPSDVARVLSEMLGEVK
jgi:hypothetical protein